MFRSIAVPVDASDGSDRALRVAVELAERGELPIELITVAPHDATDRLDEHEARVRTQARVVLQCTATRLYSHDPVGALVDAFDERPGALVVVGTRARGPVTELLLGSVSEAILGRTTHPLVLVGPHVADRPVGPAVIAAVDRQRTGELLAPAVVDWARRFGAEPWFVQVAPPLRPADVRSTADVSETGLVHRLAESVRELHVDAQWDVLHGRSAPDALIDFTRSMGGGIVAVASERWTDPGHVHWASTARTLVHRSPYPVLVVPVEHALVGR